MKLRKSPPLARRRRSAQIRPEVGLLEGRTLLATYYPTTAAELAYDITYAGFFSDPATIDLTANATYDLTSAVDGFYDTYNDNGLYLNSGDAQVTINGNGAMIARDSSAPTFRILGLQAGTLTLNDLTITAGRVNSGDDSRGGAGILVLGGSLTLNNVTVTGNAVTAQRGVIATGGGIGIVGGRGSDTDNPVVILNNSSVTGNSATGYADTTNSEAGTEACGGGIYVNNGVLQINGGSVSSNTATGGLGGGSARGGGIADIGTARDSNAPSQVTISGQALIGNNTAKGGQGSANTTPGTAGHDGSYAAPIHYDGFAGTAGGAASAGGDGQGGGLYVVDGSGVAALAITGAVVQGNSAAGGIGGGGSVGGGGGNALSAYLVPYDYYFTGGAGGSGGAGGAGGMAAGGGLYLTNSSTSIAASTIASNLATGGAGGAGGEGGYGGSGSPAYTEYGNNYAAGPRGANGQGGNGGAGGNANGGGLFNGAGSLSILASTLSSNTANGGATVLGGPVGYDHTQTSIDPITHRVTFAKPTAFGLIGQGGTATGGGLYNDAGSLTLSNSTVALNSSNGGTSPIAFFTDEPLPYFHSRYFPDLSGVPQPGGALAAALYNRSGSLGLTNDSLVANSASAALYHLAKSIDNGTDTQSIEFDPVTTAALDNASGFVSVANTLMGQDTESVYYNDPVTDYSDPDGTTTSSGDAQGVLTSLGSNLIQNPVQVTGLQASDQTGFAWTGFGPLANNGGPTQTIALLAGSPAINAGNNALAVDASGNPLTTDQRGAGHPRIFLGTVDIGAYEFAPPITVAVNRGGGQTTPGGTAFSGHLIAYAGAYGVPIAGLVVTLTAPSTGASGTFSNGSNTIQVVTDSNGLADSGVFTANTTVGSYSVTATEPGGGNTTFTETNAKVVTGFSQVGGSALLNGPIVLSAVLGTAAGPLANQPVTFTLTQNGAKFTATTNSQGVASVTAGTATSSSGSYPFTVSYAGTSQYAATSASGSAPVSAYGAPASLKQSSFPNNFEVGVDQATRFGVTVLDKNGNAVTGAVVSFSAPAAAGSFVGTTLATTNQYYGQALAPDFIAGSTPGNYTVTVTVVGYPGIASLSLPAYVRANTTTTTVALTGVQNGPGTLTATVTDAPTGTAPVQGAAVRFYVNGDRFTGTYVGQATTNAAGVATLPYAIGAPGSVTSVYAITYATQYLGQSESQGAGTVAIAAHGAPAKFTFVAGGGQVAPTGSSFGGLIRASVVDAYGNPVSGSNVTFSAPSGAGTFLNGGVATTDANGLATAPPFVAGTTTGAVQVTVADPLTPGVSATLAETITAATPTLAGVTLTGIRHATGTLAATLTTTAGTQVIPLVGQVVNFLINGVVVASAVTNSAGLATTTAPLAGIDVSSVAASFAGAGGYNAVQASGANALVASGAASGIAVNQGSGQGVAAGAVAATPFQAMVTDAYGNPVASASVTFTAPAGAGTFAGGSTTATVITDVNGLATAPAFTAGSAVGRVAITAAVAGVTAPASFALAIQTTVGGSVGVAWGTSGVATLATAADGLRLLPAGRNTDLPWLNLRQLTITLGAAVPLASGDVSVTGRNGTNYGPVTVTGSGTSYTITLAQPIAAADRVTVTIGNALIASFTRRLDVLPGDLNDDGVVNAQDTTLEVSAMRGQYYIPLIFTEVGGTGTPTIADYNLIRARLNSTLPPVS